MYSVVILHKKTKDGGESLRFAIRSWQKYYPELAKIAVVGDKEDWFGDNILYIPCDMGSNDMLNTVNAVKEVVAHEEIPCEFIFVGDNLFLLNRVATMHIVIPKFERHLLPVFMNPSSAGSLNKVMAIRVDNMPVLTQMPVMLEKDEIVSVLENCPELEQGQALLQPVYFEAFTFMPLVIDWRHDNWAIPVVSDKPVSSGLDKYLRSKFFMYHLEKGWCKELKDKLAKLFPEPSVYEQTDS